MNSRCVHYGSCGGCDFKGAPYAEQLEYKSIYCKNLFSRFDVKESLPVVPSPDLTYYRNKMEFAVTCSGPSVVIGLRQKENFGKVTDIRGCPVFFKDLGRILSVFRDWAEEQKVRTYDFSRQSGEFRYLILRHSKTNGAVMAIIVCALGREEFEKKRAGYCLLADRLKADEWIKSVYVCLNEKLADKALTDELMLISGDGHIMERIVGIDYLIGPGTFFQSNTSCCEMLYRAIKQEVGSVSGDVLDIYCGSGGIALQLAGAAGKITGVDNSAKNIEAAKENARLNRISGVEFLCMDAEFFLSDKKAFETADTAIVDPPRSGLGNKFRQALIGSNIENIIYVSCNPLNLRQDLISMEKTYSVEKIVPFDMFPFTRHIEVMARLRRL